MADRVSVAARNLGWARYAGQVAGEEENVPKHALGRDVYCRLITCRRGRF